MEEKRTDRRRQVRPQNREIETHAENCNTVLGFREMRRDIRSLWDEIKTIGFLDRRILALETEIAEMRSGDKANTKAVHKIQEEIESDNTTQMWVGRALTAILFMVVTFLLAKYT